MSRVSSGSVGPGLDCRSAGVVDWGSFWGSPSWQSQTGRVWVRRGRNWRPKSLTPRCCESKWKWVGTRFIPPVREGIVQNRDHAIHFHVMSSFLSSWHAKDIFYRNTSEKTIVRYYCRRYYEKCTHSVTHQGLVDDFAPHSFSLGKVPRAACGLCVIHTGQHRGWSQSQGGHSRTWQTHPVTRPKSIADC